MRKSTSILLAGIVLALGGIALATASSTTTRVDFPKGYRNWAHVKSMILEEGHPLYADFGGLHHLYANEKAMRGYRSGNFPDGAVIVFDLLEASRADHAVTAGPRKVVGVMARNAEEFAETGGWGFEAFAEGDPSRPLVAGNARAACFECHRSQSDREYVFSKWNE